MELAARKANGAYYTPEDVVASLVQWAVRDASDCLLDPSCGDGRFLAKHANAVGVEQDHEAVAQAHRRAPSAVIHQGEFFLWASQTSERFDCAAGNPPFIRYQSFAGPVRQRAINLCRKLGVQVSGLASSWAPFLIATASLLKPGGRMAFIVPAEIGHAPYAVPVLEYLTAHFAKVHVVAVRDKLFPELSEDCWLLYAAGRGERSGEIRLTAWQSFGWSQAPPANFEAVPLAAWRSWRCRLRPFLLDHGARRLYEEAAAAPSTRRLGQIAKVGIGYVTGDNDFFHLRPSEAERYAIPGELLHPAVRSSRVLSGPALTQADVDDWLRRDQPVLLLRLPKRASLPASVARYLASPRGEQARGAYKCRHRQPWFAVPDVRVPDAFLSYMSGSGPALVANHARCVCSNAVHAVTLRNGATVAELQKRWTNPMVSLSVELEGHPLGGGMLKLEPGEAAQVILPSPSDWPEYERTTILGAVARLKEWRHYA